MKPDEAFELLDAVGVIESEKDGLFVAMVYPSYPYDQAEGCKLLIDHENITDTSFNSLIDQATSRGKRIERLFHAGREMTIIYTPHENSIKEQIS